VAALSAFRRPEFQSVTAKLADGSDAGLAAFKDSVSRDRRFSIGVLREPEYYARQAKLLSNLMNILGYAVATFMALCATFGALNCMYSAIVSRQVEIATLRAIGFGGLPVVVPVMIEALLLALLGGAVGGALAYVYCDGASLSTLNFNTFAQVAFDFRVTPRLLGQGLAWALVIGTVGGLLPANSEGAAAGDARAAHLVRVGSSILTEFVGRAPSLASRPPSASPPGPD
jgi:putative ABC transport system permease protein